MLFNCIGAHLIYFKLIKKLKNKILLRAKLLKNPFMPINFPLKKLFVYNCINLVSILYNPEEFIILPKNNGMYKLLFVKCNFFPATHKT